jgi:hypothetical protein
MRVYVKLSRPRCHNARATVSFRGAEMREKMSKYRAWFHEAAPATAGVSDRCRPQQPSGLAATVSTLVTAARNERGARW